MIERQRLAGTILALAVLAPVASPASETPSAAGSDFFEENIRPLLAEHCYRCHSAESKRLRGGLRLDTPEGWLKGGDLGPAVTPGDPADSLLLVAVSHEDELMKMPPEGKLDDDQIALLTRWVEMGAPGPHEAPSPGDATAPSADAEERPVSWAFRPPTDPTVPQVNDADWTRNEIDHFILAELEAKGIGPAPTADRRTLIRRATFDLTGLPPTPEEVDAFLDDDAPGAFDRVVDRLLASSAYGERWGRHWLDLARYADSNGLDENVAHGNAWRYRDFVVDAFNRDMPYDQFLTEQLAGDLLPPSDSTAESHRRLIATGFLTLGPKVLAEPDVKKMEMDIVDEQVDTVGRTFLGLTFGCARCHDHKFDPISAADYYGLAGIFVSTKTMESFKTVAQWHENSLATEDDLARKADHDQKVAALKADIDRLEGKTEAKPGGAEAADPEETAAELGRLREELTALEREAPEMPSAMGTTEGTVADVPIHIRGSHLTLGEVVSRRVPEVFDAPTPPEFPDDRSGRLELARWMVDPGHPLTSRVMVNRLWRWHFGRGLVGTPDNFGTLGEPPTHPALLDWLARRFVAEGWSIKAMHRIIMTSSTYRMGSDFDPAAARVDPENDLRWRSDVRRLEAEAIRDALLAVGGSLDRRMGGSMLTVGNRDYFFNHTSKDATTYESPRRSIYLPVVRNHLYDMFQLFDATDASVIDGDRATTTVAPQALFVMNSELMLEAALGLATLLRERPDLDDDGRIRLLYERALNRPPSAEETARAASFLDRIGRELGDDGEEGGRLVAWQVLCQAILASNEFMTIR